MKPDTDYKITDKLFVLIHPSMVALYVFLLALYFTPNYFEKYQAEIIETKEQAYSSKLFYHDLDEDSLTEILYMGNSSLNKSPNIYYSNCDNEIINQWNLEGELLENFKPYFGDYNHNGLVEVYCLTLKDDSIFLNANELLAQKGLLFTNRYICKAGIFNNSHTDIFEIDGVFMDINKDGYSEFVFTLFGGFSKYPRNTFAYYIHEDSLVSSPYSASGLRSSPQYIDLNNDGVPEITGTVYASENIHYDIPLTDSSAWLVVLDPTKGLNYLFPPIEYDKGISSSITPLFYEINDKKYIATSFYGTTTIKKTNTYSIKLFDSKGKLLKERKIDRDKYSFLYFLKQKNKSDEHFYLINTKGDIYIADTALQLRIFNNSKKSPSPIRYNKPLIDIDNDGKNEYLITSNTTPLRLNIYQNDLKKSVVLELPNTKRTNQTHFTLKKTAKNKPPVLVFQADSHTFHINYGENKYYLMKYPMYIGVYLFLLFVFSLLQKAQNTIAKRRFETEKQLIHQQLAISKNQLEPHFMLNTLNNIGYMFTKDDKHQAMYYFGKFAALIRRGLMYADKVETSLEKEIEFIEDYLILQKHLLDGELDFIIENKDDIDLEKIKVPHSLIYTFVENAIKHGLRPKEKDRNLRVEIIQTKNDKVIITIIDNGIGRKKSKELGTTDTGKGMEIVKSIVRGYNKLYGGGISYEIRDLLGEGDVVLGTEVVVFV